VRGGCGMGSRGSFAFAYIRPASYFRLRIIPTPRTYILRLDTATSLSFLLVAGRQSISIPFHPERIRLSASPFFTATRVKSTLISRYSTTLLVYTLQNTIPSMSDIFPPCAIAPLP
jgi:hypothetical protein